MDHADTVRRLLDTAGDTFATEAGITLENEPTALYRLLVLTVLLSSRVNSKLGTAACRGLVDAGMGTPQGMHDSTTRQRVAVLDEANYTRTDERTAVALGEGADLVLDRWDGDLRRMRADADGDFRRLREHLTAIPQLGPVGADIFTREVQLVWPEFRPHLDAKALAGARELGLPDDPATLADLVSGDELAVLSSALVRAGRDHHVAEDVAGD